MDLKLFFQVFAVKDERLGEEVACVVRLRQGTMTHEDLKKHLKERVRYVFFFFRLSHCRANTVESEP